MVSIWFTILDFVDKTSRIVDGLGSFLYLFIGEEDEESVVNFTLFLLYIFNLIR